ncbi:unnamed protein product, partial [Musa acuminata var. zebrina]
AGARPRRRWSCWEAWRPSRRAVRRSWRPAASRHLSRRSRPARRGGGSSPCTPCSCSAPTAPGTAAFSSARAPSHRSSPSRSAAPPEPSSRRRRFSATCASSGRTWRGSDPAFRCSEPFSWMLQMVAAHG